MDLQTLLKKREAAAARRANKEKEVKPVVAKIEEVKEEEQPEFVPFQEEIVAEEQKEEITIETEEASQVQPKKRGRKPANRVYMVTEDVEFANEEDQKEE